MFNYLRRRARSLEGSNEMNSSPTEADTDLERVPKDAAKIAIRANQEARLAGYQEICKSYHAIDDFRMKRLGSLPLAS
jgi:hypothetical protein